MDDGGDMGAPLFVTKSSSQFHANVPQDDTPVMPESCKPHSFLLTRPLARPQPAFQAESDNPESVPSAESTSEPIEPRSLPRPTYLPPPPRKKHILEDFLVIVDGRRCVNLDGDIFPITWESHPGPQSRYPDATPIPGVSKKGRGRRAPTKEDGVRKGTTYTCKVEDCRKTFGRSEHLKRHVRSLHMHERNYMCSLPICSSQFTRRDNLIAHERRHKHYQALFDCTKDFKGELMPQYRPRPPDLVAEGWALAATPFLAGLPQRNPLTPLFAYDGRPPDPKALEFLAECQARARAAEAGVEYVPPGPGESLPPAVPVDVTTLPKIPPPIPVEFEDTLMPDGVVVRGWRVLPHDPSATDSQPSTSKSKSSKRRR
ncbi:uncharacterized protein FIBRA_04873 [Fibroporia radiculosa]|uniref:C2H2-type domain-containing protein n=1 Tax=Fibroporia radiculosa TaxID=599839 RepID=J4GPZ1_9APHY|nr:uncharacterized protein FIBRA_04873 [Fibroporia radiculosa]CCM02765.1 predicted protein [Fibroporia radiculosa]